MYKDIPVLRCNYYKEVAGQMKLMRHDGNEVTDLTHKIFFLLGPPLYHLIEQLETKLHETYKNNPDVLKLVADIKANWCYRTINNKKNELVQKRISEMNLKGTELVDFANLVLSCNDHVPYDELMAESTSPSVASYMN